MCVQVYLFIFLILLTLTLYGSIYSSKTIVVNYKNRRRVYTVTLLDVSITSFSFVASYCYIVLAKFSSYQKFSNTYES